MNMKKSKTRNISKDNSAFEGIFLFVLRIILGFMLFTKGFIFLRNDGILRRVFSETALVEKISILRMMIPWIHILGGFLILIGLYTRQAAFVQLPLVIGAIFVLLNAKQYPFFKAEMFFAVSILVLLGIFLKFGDGFYSWKNLLQKGNDVS